MSNTLTLPGSNHSDLLGSLAQEFREGFADLSETAARELSGKNFIFSRYGKELYPYFEESDASVAPGCIIPLKQGRPIASVDSTCVLIGETSKGALYAARAAVGISFEGALRRFVRLGPVLAYASEAGISGIRSELSSLEMSAVLADHAVAEGVIRNTMERKVIDSLLYSDEDLIVMADGSLRHPFGQFSGSLPSALRNRNCLVGFSKSSNLIFSEGPVSALTQARAAAYHTMEKGPVTTVLAKFAADGLVFRLDLTSAPDGLEELLGMILWNDAFAAGYPESLKVAHHLSVFTRADGQALRALVSKKFGVRRLPTFTLRRIALGSFKGGS